MLAEPPAHGGAVAAAGAPKFLPPTLGGLAVAGVQEDPEAQLPSQAGSAAGIALEKRFASTGGPPSAPAEL